ncbi:sensor histidine kinase [Nonomuraea sp. NPDC046802]|uniref:sensor histidine kinase n=1 Tax=Nonomuraea sp. NPDC046802 TaxID=3154919 RepID=UPI003403EDAA
MISVQRIRRLGRRIPGRRPSPPESPAAVLTDQSTPLSTRLASPAEPGPGETAEPQSDNPADPHRHVSVHERPRGRGGFGRMWEVGALVVRPFQLALFQGDADPPPESRRLSLRVPLPWLETINLVQIAELILAWVLFGTTLSMVLTWNAEAGSRQIWEGFTYLTALAAGLPVVLRDRWPLAAWRVAAVMTPVTVWVAVTIGRSGNGPPYLVPVVVMYLLVLYSVAVRCDRRITLAVWIITVLAAWIIHPNSMALVSVIVSVVVLFGYNVRIRRTATAKLAQEERRTQEAEGAQAVLAERARIARELHDVVAHHMSVIAIQAEAVPLKAAGDPAQLEAGLAEIRGLSLEAIAELRNVLGVLRDQDGRTDTAPQPGFDRIDELVANARAAGLAVLVRRAGELTGLPPAVGLSAYRIVQESLSNAMRHAPGATVAVDISRERDTIRVWVANGPGTTPTSGPAAEPTDGATQTRGARQGLVGMRERAALLGGALEAGPSPDGGFEVRATLPIPEQESVS